MLGEIPHIEFLNPDGTIINWWERIPKVGTEKFLREREESRRLTEAYWLYHFGTIPLSDDDVIRLRFTSGGLLESDDTDTSTE